MRIVLTPMDVYTVNLLNTKGVVVSTEEEGRQGGDKGT